tara:strand:+ start:362 stop:571 length:210 start_codon:yes stop_codon:yes gene_type:complete
MDKTKPETVSIQDQFNYFNKWETYGNVFALMDAKKTTLRKIISIAGKYGISEGVVRMRRNQFITMKRSI